MLLWGTLIAAFVAKSWLILFFLPVGLLLWSLIVGVAFVASHVPLFWASGDGLGLFGHADAANPQFADVTEPEKVYVVFSGPDIYILARDCAQARTFPGIVSPTREPLRPVPALAPASTTTRKPTVTGEERWSVRRPVARCA